MKTKLVSRSAVSIPGFSLAELSKAECPWFSSPVNLGSAPDNHLVLAFDTVSRRHACLQIIPQGVLLKDLESTNGTFVNGIRIREAILESPCTLRLGEKELLFKPLVEIFEPNPLGQCSLAGIMGVSEPMQKLFSLIKKMAPSDLSVLIQGPTGVGKELVARALHQLSGRAKGPFVVVDCSCISPNLAESELFGHRKGSFTGAVEGRMGLFELAQGGTVFLDEIGEMPLELQPKLLRVLENHEFRPIGSPSSRSIDTRVIAATNRDLAREVEEGRFRRDLLYRLEILKLPVPPLSQRREDIPLLLEYFVDLYGCNTPFTKFTPRAMGALMNHPWPGNVRELKHLVQSVMALSEGGPIDLEDLGLCTDEIPLLRSYRDKKELAANQFEREFIRDILRKNKGNVAAAARDADMDRKYLKKLMDKHGISLTEAGLWQ